MVGAQRERVTMSETPTPTKGMLCPVCYVPLVMAERGGVEIDYCPQCRGVWLDRGELDKIIARAAVEHPETPQASPFLAPDQYSQQQQYQPGYPQPPPQYYPQQGQPQRSWWREIFD
jgi:Zn-finger nucleic acid-binding protein